MKCYSTMIFAWLQALENFHSFTLKFLLFDWIGVFLKSKLMAVDCVSVSKLNKMIAKLCIKFKFESHVMCKESLHQNGRYGMINSVKIP